MPSESDSVESSEVECLPLALVGDERCFLQVLINLTNNAIKFTSGGNVTIKLAYNSEQQNILVHVEDTGAGIAAEEIPKICKRFGKLHRTADMNHEGIGLGLVIVREIVQ